MSIKSLQNSNTNTNSLDYRLKLLEIKARDSFAKQYKPWVRNSEWPALPTIAPSEQKIAMLVAIYPSDGHYLAFNVAGAYTIDWGDGTTENIASGVQCNHAYDYSTISSSPISAGYKTVTIVITPQAGQNLTTFNTNVKYALSGVTIGNYNTQILDMAVSMPNGTSIVIGNQSPVIYHRDLENIDIISSAITNCGYFLGYCAKLQKYTINSSANITNFTSFAVNCFGLTYGHYVDTSKATDATGMFTSCYNLLSTAYFDFSSLLIIRSMFENCRNLIFVPWNRLPKVTNMNLMFINCPSLLVSPNFYAPLAVNVYGVYNNCSSLTLLPKLYLPSATDMSYVATTCASLQRVPDMYTPLVTNVSNAFNNCVALEEVEWTFSSLVTNYSSLFQGCSSLTKIPTIDCTSATSLASAFNNCISLKSLNLKNSGNVTSFNSMANGNSSLTTATGIDITSATNIQSMFQACQYLASASVTDSNTLSWVTPSQNNNWAVRTMAINPSGSIMYTAQSTAYMGLMKWDSGNNRFVYTNNATSTNGNNINAFVAPDGKHCYVGSTSLNTLAQHPILTNGALGTATLYSMGANGRPVISPDGTKVFGMNTSTTLYYYTRTSSGINSSAASITTATNNVDGVVSTDSLFLYTVSGTQNTIKVFSINQTSGLPTLASTISTGLNNPTNITISPDNKHIYVSNYNSSNMLVYTRDTGTGALTLVQTVTLFAASYRPVISSDGNFLYIPNYASSGIQVFSRDSSTGFVTLITSYRTLPNPYQIVLHPDGTYLHLTVSNASSVSQIVSFPRDTVTGLLTATVTSITALASAFSGCNRLTTIPDINMSGLLASSNIGGGGEYSATTSGAKQSLYAQSVANSKLTIAGLNAYIENQQRPFSPGQTLTLSSNPGYRTGNLTGTTWASNSLTITCASTAALKVGYSLQQASFNQTLNASWTFNASTGFVSFSGGRSFTNGTRISFLNITTTMGIATYYPYYIVNSSGNTFQLAYTAGGTPIMFDNNGTSTSANFEVLVTGITSLTQFTVDTLPFNNGSNTTLTYVSCRTNFSTMKGWNAG